jgi:hypothetical protein
MKVSLRMLDLAYVCWAGGSKHLAHTWIFSGPYVRRRIGEWRQLGPGMRVESNDKLTTTIFQAGITEHSVMFPADMIKVKILRVAPLWNPHSSR